MENKNINLKKLIKTLNNKNVKDYLYLTIFFLIFSVFIMFAIRPVIVTAFALKNQEKELEEKNLTYTQAIAHANSNFKILEEIRDRVFLINDAVPDSPQINKVVNDIQDASNQSSLTLNNIFLPDKVDYKDPKNKDFKNVKVSVKENGSFESVIDMINILYSQRRLKNIDTMDIFNQTIVSTDSGTLEVQVDIIGFYL
ncbi:MAG: hypothetical protein ABH812_03320 [bacterium]